jgi:hypothetical protein
MIEGDEKELGLIFFSKLLSFMFLPLWAVVINEVCQIEPLRLMDAGCQVVLLLLVDEREGGSR